MQRQASGRFPALLLIAILLLVAVGWTLRLLGESKLLAAEERFDAETGSLSLADYVRPGLEDKENAAIWLRAGAEALRISESSAAVLAEALDQDLDLWSSETREMAASLSETNRPAFEQLEKCAGLEGSNFDFAYEEGFSAVIPPMLDLYRAGRLAALDLRLALADADSERVSRDLEILDQLSWALARESFLMSALIHLGVERLFLGAIRDVVYRARGRGRSSETSLHVATPCSRRLTSRVPMRMGYPHDLRFKGGCNETSASGSGSLSSRTDWLDDGGLRWRPGR